MINFRNVTYINKNKTEFDESQKKKCKWSINVKMIHQWPKWIIFLHLKDKTKYDNQFHLLVLGNQDNGQNKCYPILLGIPWVTTILFEIILEWSVNIRSQLIFEPAKQLLKIVAKKNK